MERFEELDLSPEVLRAIKEMGFEEPTPVQAQAIPHLRAGRDVVAQALTGTGKTAAFGIPLVESFDPRLNAVQAIVLTPTRELAVQVAEHVNQLGRYKGLRLVPIYGGQPIDRQLRALSRGVHAIVATPGRMMDHMRRGSLDLSAVRMLVLDEADQMLHMGFQEDVDYVVSHLNAERVTALFSATIPQPIMDLISRYMKAPEIMRLSRPQALTVPEIEQVHYVVPFPRKLDALCRVLDVRQPERAMVFCATKRMVDEVVERLQARGYSSDGLHGDMSQANREKALKAFRDARTEVLVATDVAARGLDIPDVALIVNFDVPPDPEYYVHRIGRTGRVGKSGVAITFVNPREMPELRMIERVTGARIRRGEVPTSAEAEEREAQQFQERLLDVLGKGGWGPFREMVEGMAGDYDPLDVAAAALAMAAGKTGNRRRQEQAEPASSGQPEWNPPAPSPHRREQGDSGPPRRREHFSQANDRRQPFTPMPRTPRPAPARDWPDGPARPSFEGEPVAPAAFQGDREVQAAPRWAQNPAAGQQRSAPAPAQPRGERPAALGPARPARRGSTKPKPWAAAKGAKAARHTKRRS